MGIIIITVCLWFVAYLFFPENITGKKNEYITCIGSSFFLYSCLFIFATRIFLTGKNWVGVDSNANFAIGFWIFFAVYHRLYPFKRTERNQVLTFFLLGTSLLFLFLWASLWVLVYFSKM